MSGPTSPTYRTRNWPAYSKPVREPLVPSPPAHAPKRRGSLTIWFAPEMSWDAAPTGRRGRQQTYSDAAIQTCLSMKVLFGMALKHGAGRGKSTFMVADHGNAATARMQLIKQSIGPDDLFYTSTILQ
nr:transposase [Rhodovulum sulfidophilum]